ncbi:hypothetical protein V5O48_016375, partial [Marasmius crinis-equi]
MPAGKSGLGGPSLGTQVGDQGGPHHTAQEKGKGKEVQQGVETGVSNEALPGQVENAGELGQNPSQQPPPKRKPGRPKKDPSISAKEPTRRNASSSNKQGQVDEVHGVETAAKRPSKKSEENKSTVKWLAVDARKGKKAQRVEGPPNSDEGPVSELRPPHWCSSKTELLAIQPELSCASFKGVACNDIGLPIMLLDGQNRMTVSSLRTEKDESSGQEETIMDVEIVRDFECLAKDLPGFIDTFSQNDTPVLSAGLPSISLHDRALVGQPLPPKDAKQKRGGKNESEASQKNDAPRIPSIKHEQPADPCIELRHAGPTSPVSRGRRQNPRSRNAPVSAKPTEAPSQKRPLPPATDEKIPKKIKTEDITLDNNLLDAPNPSTARSKLSMNLRPRKAHGVGMRTFVPSLESLGANVPELQAPHSRHSGTPTIRPPLSIDTQCYADGLPMSPMSPLSPASPPPIPIARKPRSEPTRRSSRLAGIQLKTEDDEIPFLSLQIGKRKRELTQDDDRPRMMPRLYLSEASIRSHGMRTRAMTKEEPVDLSISEGPLREIRSLRSTSQATRKLHTTENQVSRQKGGIPQAPQTSTNLVPAFLSRKAISKSLKSKMSSQPVVEHTIPPSHPSPALTDSTLLDLSTITSSSNPVAVSPSAPGMRPEMSVEDALAVIPSVGSNTPQPMMRSIPVDLTGADMNNRLSAVLLVRTASDDTLVDQPEGLTKIPTPETASGGLIPQPIPTGVDIPTLNELSLQTTSEESHQIPLPTQIPSEVQVLMDAQTNNTPVFGIASREQFAASTGTSLPIEHAYVYTGFWRVQNIKASCVQFTAPSKTTQRGPDRKVCGRAQWTLTFCWVPGREEVPDSSIPRPWWCSDKSVDLQPTANYITLVSSTLLADVENDGVLGEDGWSLGDGDAGSSRGWYCSDCGKLNRQTFWRRRKCGSKACEDKAVTACSVKALDVVRDRGQLQPLFLPNNTVPAFIEPVITDWEDGRRTFVYKTGSTSEIKHVFTCNFPDVQEEQTDLFSSIQAEVLLQRRAEDTSEVLTSCLPLSQAHYPFNQGLYFSYAVADTPAAFTLAGVYNASVSTWTEARPCITQTREMLSFISQYYGEVETPTVRDLLLLAWTVDGRRKATAPLQAKERSIVLMALGHEIVISVTPKSGLGHAQTQRVDSIEQSSTNAPPVLEASAVSPTDISSLTPMAVKEEPLDDVVDLDAPGLIPFIKDEFGDPGQVVDFSYVMQANPTAVELQSMASPSLARKQQPQKIGSKENNVLKFTLVHGDALILSGDDFEYTIQREGISILLIANLDSSGNHV